jgi:hypothetical protein
MIFTPPSSKKLAAAWRPYIETCIEAFGPEPSTFESNLPPDKSSRRFVGRNSAAYCAERPT